MEDCVVKWCAWCFIFLLLQLGGGDSQFCTGVPDNFAPLSNILEENGEALVSLPSNEVPLGEWIFPNILRFGCSGRITGWIFRGEPGVDLDGIRRLPQWSLYRNHPVTENELDFLVIVKTGSHDELEEAEQQPGVYRYMLSSPVDVEVGDFVGVSYQNALGTQLRISFLDVGRDGRETPISFRRGFSTTFLFLADFAVEENRYMPLVAPIMADTPTPAMPLPTSTDADIQTSIIAPLPTPSPTPDLPVITVPQPPTEKPQTTVNSLPTQPPTTARTPTTMEPLTATATEPPTPTELPPTAATATEPPTPTELSPTATATATESPPTVTELPTTTIPQIITSAPSITDPQTMSETEGVSTNLMSMTTEEVSPQASGVKLGVIVGVVASVFTAVLIMVVLVILVLVLMKRRKQRFKVHKSQFVSPLDNPVYQVANGTLEEDSKRASMDPDYATLKANQQGHTHNGRLLLNRPTQEENSISSNGNSVNIPQYEMFGASQKMNSSSLIYQEVGPISATDEVKEPQDYALPVTPTHSTIDYEIPVASDHVTVDSRGHKYRELEQGIYVPTIGERELYLSNIEAASRGSNTPDTFIYSRISQNYRGQLHQGSFFLEDDIYWAPASSKKALYDQLSRKKYREILRQQIRIQKHLGSGQFGMVNMGEWSQYAEVMVVAIKTLVPDSTDEDKVKFLQEAAIMGQFAHPNVVKLYGVVTVGEPVMIVLEYMQKGDLRNYLLARQPKHGQPVDASLPHLLLKFCREIAEGMDYLSSKSFVHRDLAARNILIGIDNTCKIGDFGMSRNLEDSNYYITHGGRIPVKWTAPEALNFRKYSTASDVWSFGAVMYETWGLGRKPFEGYTNTQTMDMVLRGFRLPPPPGCPRALYELMIRCWHSEPVRRPVFFAVKKMLSHSDSQLLSWSSKDLSVHPLVSVLGAPREATDDLYQELQDYYLKE